MLGILEAMQHTYCLRNLFLKRFYLELFLKEKHPGIMFYIHPVLIFPKSVIPNSEAVGRRMVVMVEEGLLEEEWCWCE